jgi:hypothetical protein
MPELIEISNSLGGEILYSPELIKKLVSEKPQEMKHGETFTGRPSTLIRADQNYAVKIRTEQKFDLPTARQWIESTRNKEITCQVHHPHKTWFIYLDGTIPLIGNICPLLNPLHRIFDMGEVSTNAYLEYMGSLFELYFRVMRDHGMRLDEGLSNFGIDENQNLYYLDDDIYSFDSYHSLSHMLGVYIRKYEWLTNESCIILGEIVTDFIEQGDNSQSNRSIIVEYLKNLYMPPGRALNALNILVQTIAPDFKH